MNQNLILVTSSLIFFVNWFSIMSDIRSEVVRRRTFAIISHPDAGKTTLTEKLLLFGGAIQLAGTVKGRKAQRHATSDWMELEKQRGISVTTSVMQFVYKDKIINLLDTPGHEDFSEDTYRTLTAVDSALMVVDSAKGVEERTMKLMDVCRLRSMPIYTFINKLDREGLEPITLLDEVEDVLNIQCAPITWPIGSGKRFKGVFHLYNDCVHIFTANHGGKIQHGTLIQGLHNEKLDELLEGQADELRDEIELVRGASHVFSLEQYLAGQLSPVFFGSAINNFGIEELLDSFITNAPSPQPYATNIRKIRPEEEKFTGFVFKIQANMDPAHRDRIAFLRVCSGAYTKGMKMFQVRSGRTMRVNNAITFMASNRTAIDSAFSGDIIGLHNHGTIQIGDTFSEGDDLKFYGIPNFAPELFRKVILKDPLRAKALHKGLIQLCEEGASQLFRPLVSNDLIVGAVGVLQFDVVAYRLKNEYGVDCKFEQTNITVARWTTSENEKKLAEFQRKASSNLALDAQNQLTYIAPTKVNLEMAIERWPDIQFHATREH